MYFFAADMYIFLSGMYSSYAGNNYTAQKMYFPPQEQNYFASV
jgi:hypothetical protein